MKNKQLTSVLAGSLVLYSCAIQKELSQIQTYKDPCQNEWTDSLFNEGHSIEYPTSKEGTIDGNISGTKRSQIKGESQLWETFKAFGEDYYARRDITAKNPIGFDLTKKNLVAIAYSPVTGKTEAFPLAIYHPVQIVDSVGKPHKELTIENIALKDPKFSGCKINENKIDFKDYKIETTVIDKQTYLIVKPQANIDERERLSLYLIPLTPDVLLVQDPQAGKLKIRSTGEILRAYKLINEELMHYEQPVNPVIKFQKGNKSPAIPTKVIGLSSDTKRIESTKKETKIDPSLNKKSINLKK